MSAMAARNIPLSQLYPDGDGPIALNVCGDPDCGNFGVKPDFTLGRVPRKSKHTKTPQSNAAAIGLGRYALRGASTEKGDKRKTRVEGLIDEELIWSDRDRRITPLNCSISADADSGYVYRADVDFDPRWELLNLFKRLYRDDEGLLKEHRARIHVDQRRAVHDAALSFPASVRSSQ